MFTGIIETLARVEKIERQQSNVHFTFSCSITGELRAEQSVAHNGVCLTVTKTTDSDYSVTAIDETIKRTNLGELKQGDLVNIERCMPANGRFDGHIVQGHVDVTATCINVKDMSGSYEYVFEYPSGSKNFTVQKGSIAVNGVSLTVVRSEARLFSVHVIPYTLERTNFREIKKGSSVNIEFDIIGKYIARMVENK
jgi:riboflavin synthase